MFEIANYVFLHDGGEDKVMFLVSLVEFSSIG